MQMARASDRLLQQVPASVVSIVLLFIIALIH